MRSFKECGIKSTIDDYHQHLKEFMENDLDGDRENVFVEEDEGAMNWTMWRLLGKYLIYRGKYLALQGSYLK